MKELSIEEKAKAYDEALRKAKEALDSLGDNYICNHLTKDDVREMYANLFPVLKESEGERIRKDIISHFAKGIEGSSFDEVREKYKIWIAWLKQGEQGLNAITPKFKVGDKVVHKETGKTWTVHWYLADTNSYYVIDEEELIHHYSEDVLESVGQNLAEWNEEDKKILQAIWHSIDNECLDKNGVDTGTAFHWLESIKFRIQPQLQWKLSDEQIKDLNKAANEWDCKASFSPIAMVMDGDRPIGTKQHITSHADSFKAGVDWVIKKLKG